MTLAEQVKAHTTQIAEGVRNRILILDVERTMAYVEGRSWGRDDFKNRWLPSDFIKQPARIICFGARWYGEDDITFRAEWHRGGHQKMIKDLHRLLGQADFVTTHNGDRADLPWFRESLPQYGLKYPKPFKSIDTYKVMRREFPAYHSKSLVEAAKFLGIPYTKQGRWSLEVADAACAGDRAMREQLETYQLGDVVLQGAVYDGLRGYMPNHPHFDGNDSELQCNQCASVDLRRDGEVLKVVQTKAAYQCRNCGGWTDAGIVRRIARNRGTR